MKLYHYSNKELKVISPKFFGDNSYSFNEKKYPINRSFFYLEPTPKEYHLKNSKYCYTVNIELSRLYDLRKDKENLKIKFENNIAELLLYIKKNYRGAIYNLGFNIAILFNDITVITKRQVKNGV